MGNKNRISKLSVKVTNTTVGNKDATFHTIASGKINSSMKKHDGNNDTPKSSSESHNTTKSIVAKQSSSSTYSSVRPVSTCISNTVHENTIKNPRDYTAPKKFPNETDSNIKNYPIQSDYKQSMSVNSPDYKNTSIAGSITANLPLRFATQQSSTATPVIHREIYTPSSTYSPQSGSCQRNDNSAFAVARKALEQQQSSMPKMAPINFPPLRAPQSIVNVRHPLLTDARIKHGNETIGGGISGGGVSVGSVGVGGVGVSSVGVGGVGVSSGKSKLNIIGSLQGGGIKDLSDHTGRSQTTFHGYGTSPIAPGIPSVQNLSSAVTANIPPYPRPEPFPQPTVANVLFPDTAAQFPQSPPFNTTPQIGQLNQYQTYDPGSYPTTPVNVNPVIPQFPAESSIPYPQYENPPQFVQPSHYPTADITNSQYQYQAAAAAAASVGQIQDSSIFIQSLQSTIAVTDQYATPNYARTVRTELITRLRRPPRFNK